MRVLDAFHDGLRLIARHSIQIYGDTVRCYRLSPFILLTMVGIYIHGSRISAPPIVPGFPLAVSTSPLCSFLAHAAVALELLLCRAEPLVRSGFPLWDHARMCDGHLIRRGCGCYSLPGDVVRPRVGVHCCCAGDLWEGGIAFLVDGGVGGTAAWMRRSAAGDCRHGACAPLWGVGCRVGGVGPLLVGGGGWLRGGGTLPPTWGVCRPPPCAEGVVVARVGGGLAYSRGGGVAFGGGGWAWLGVLREGAGPPATRASMQSARGSTPRRPTPYSMIRAGQSCRARIRRPASPTPR